MKTDIKNLIVISDLHCGCQFGLCPERVVIDGGGTYRASRNQRRMLQLWRIFWDEWVPTVTRKEPYAVLINGDLMDGRHHGANTLVSNNLADQQKIAEALLEPIKEKAKGGLYVIRGTESHAGPAAENEEELAKTLEAVPDDQGRHSRFEAWIRVGRCLVHAAHHIGVTSSMAYETTALTKEYTESCADAAKWGLPPPNVVVRSHRHRHIEVRVPSGDGYGIVMVTAGWQLKAPYAWRLPGGRITVPQVGGSLIRQGDEEHYTRHKIWPLKRSKTVVATLR